MKAVPSTLPTYRVFLAALHQLWCARPCTRTPILRRIAHEGHQRTAEIVDCVTRSASPWLAGNYGIVLANVQPSEFIPVSGAFSFFDWRKRLMLA
jgi:hypothetical protein